MPFEMRDGVLTVVAHGRPRPQPRPRFYFANGRINVISNHDPNTREWRLVLDLLYRDVLDAHGAEIAAWGQGALEIDMSLLFSIKDRKRWGQAHTSRPDVDNLSKAVLDQAEASGLLNRDQQVAIVRIAKYWNEHDGMVMTIRPLSSGLPDAVRDTLGAPGA